MTQLEEVILCKKDGPSYPVFERRLARSLLYKGYLEYVSQKHDFAFVFLQKINTVDRGKVDYGDFVGCQPG